MEKVKDLREAGSVPNVEESHRRMEAFDKRFAAKKGKQSSKEQEGKIEQAHKLIHEALVSAQNAALEIHNKEMELLVFEKQHPNDLDGQEKLRMEVRKAFEKLSATTMLPDLSIDEMNVLTGSRKDEGWRALIAFARNNYYEIVLIPSDVSKKTIVGFNLVRGRRKQGSWTDTSIDRTLHKYGGKHVVRMGKPAIPEVEVSKVEEQVKTAADKVKKAIVNPPQQPPRADVPKGMDFKAENV